MRELVLRPYRPGDESAIRELFQRTYAREMSEAYWRWRFAESPGGHAFVELAWAGDTLAGHYAVTQLGMLVEGAMVRTGLSGTTMTHPEYRGRGLFVDLARSTYVRMAEQGLDYVWGFPNTNSHRGFIERLDWFDIHEVPTLEGPVGALPVPPERPQEVEEIERATSEVDALWERVRASAAVSVIRDAAYVNWRFADNPSASYRLFVHRGASGCDGLAVTKRYGDALQVVEMLCDDESDVGLTLVEEALRSARAQGAARINLWLNVGTHLHRRLEKWGMVPTAPVTYLGAASLRAQASPAFRSYGNWRISMSDSDVY